MNSPFLSLATRVRAWPPRAVDGTLATLVLLGTTLEVVLVDAPAADRAAAVLPAALAGTGLLVRRREPIGAVALVLAALVSTVVLTDRVWNALTVMYLALLFVTYSMAVRENGTRLRTGIAVAVVGSVLVTLTGVDRDAPNGFLATLLLGLTLFVVAPIVAGRVLRSRLRLSEALEQKARLAEGDRADAAREAATRERERIAGELHDVVAHALGAMTVQAAAARRLAVTKPERATGAFEAIEATGRDALGELRTLLDALRDEDDPVGLAPARPSLTALDELVGRARSAGLRVTLDVEGVRPAELPTSLDVTAYRLIQEALQAALRDGGAAAARVVLSYRADRLEVQIVDDGVRAERKLVGLEERARMYGGRVETGDEPAGGHAVRAWLPLETVSA